MDRANRGGHAMPQNTPAGLPFAGIVRVVLALIAAAAGGALGMGGGSWLAYAIAALTDQDIATFKDMLIWSMLAGTAVGAIAGVWLALFITRASRGAQQAALIVLGVALSCGAMLMLATFDW